MKLSNGIAGATLTLALMLAQGSGASAAKHKKISSPTAPTAGRSIRQVPPPAGPHTTSTAKRAAASPRRRSPTPTPSPSSSSSSSSREGSLAVAAEPHDDAIAAAPATTKSTRTAKTNVYSFGAMDVEGKLKTPQLLYFLNRIKLELDMSAPDHRSFMKELEQTAEDPSL